MRKSIGNVYVLINMCFYFECECVRACVCVRECFFVSFFVIICVFKEMGRFCIVKRGSVAKQNGFRVNKAEGVRVLFARTRQKAQKAISLKT